MFLTKLQGRKSKRLREMIDEPIIIKLVNGKIYAGLVDVVYYSGKHFVELYECKLLSDNKINWNEHDFWTWMGDDFIRDPQPAFILSDILEIYILKSEYVDDFIYDDVLHFFIDPYYKPLKRIKCGWNIGTSHSDDCDSQLHEALSNIITSVKTKDKEEERKIQQNFEYVRRRLIKYGAKIP